MELLLHLQLLELRLLNIHQTQARVSQVCLNTVQELKKLRWESETDSSN